MPSIKITYIRAYGNSCVGCIDNESDIMLSYIDGEKITDLFLTSEAAELLLAELTIR